MKNIYRPQEATIEDIIEEIGGGILEKQRSPDILFGLDLEEVRFPLKVIPGIQVVGDRQEPDNTQDKDNHRAEQVKRE